MTKITPFRGLAAMLASTTLLSLGIPAIARASSLPPLNNPATGQRVPGKFVWADLFTDDPVAAAAFYGGLFGWTSVPVEQNDRSYMIMSNGGQPVAGIVLRSLVSPSRRPNVWIGYISVAKAKAVLSTVEASGGTTHAPVRNFPRRGLQAIFSDPEGSAVGILQSSSGDPVDAEPDPGAWNWFELYSLKPSISTSFYGRVFGYEVKEDTRNENSGHFLLSGGGRARGGIAVLPASPDSRPGWLGCVRVADIDAAVAKARASGGEVTLEPRPAALGSRFAVITDPTGGAVGLVQYVDNANPANRP